MQLQKALSLTTLKIEENSFDQKSKTRNHFDSNQENSIGISSFCTKLPHCAIFQENNLVNLLTPICVSAKLSHHQVCFASYFLTKIQQN
jgi:hypothetical protein